MTFDALMCKLPRELNTREQREAAARLSPEQRADLLRIRREYNNNSTPAGYLRRLMENTMNDPQLCRLLNHLNLSGYERKLEADAAARLSPEARDVCMKLNLKPSKLLAQAAEDYRAAE